MPIHDPHLPSNLIDSPDNAMNGAAVHALSPPPHLFDDEALAVLREQLISHLGADMARGLITAWGYELGRRDALSLGRHFSWENDTQLLLCGPRLQPLMQAGRMETKRLQLNRAQGLVDVEVVWHRCPEAAQYIERLGHAEHAVCWTLVGYYAGYCTTLLSREVQAVETTCAGMGADFCTVRLRGRDPSAAGRLLPSLQPSHAVRIMQQELERLRFESSMRLQRLEALREAVLDVAGELMLDGVQAKIVSRGRVLLGARYGFLALFQESDLRQRHLGAAQRGYVIIHDGLSQSDAADLDPFPITAGLFGAVLRDSATVRVRRVGDDPRSRGMPAHPALSASFLGVPVRVHGQLHGALYFTDRLDGGEFSLDDEKLAESFAAHAGVALENARLVETIDAERCELAHALEREQEVTSELHHVRSEQERERNLLAALLTLPDVDDVDSALHRVLGRLTSLLDADVGALSLCAEEGALQVRAMTDRGQAVELPSIKPSEPGEPGEPGGEGAGRGGAGFSWRVTEARDVVYVRDVVEDPGALEPHLRDRGVRTLLGAPLLCEGRLIGVVAVGSFAVRTFDETEWRFLRVAANFTALSIERARLHGEVARSDQLLRAVIEAAPIGMSVTVPPRGEMILSNGVMRRLSELAAQSGALPAGDAPGRALAGEVVRRVERALTCPITGGQLAVRVSAAPVRSAAGRNGTVQAAVTVVEDLTLEKEIERLRERFVQLVAHDLRNPLNAAMMHVEILRERLEGALAPSATPEGAAQAAGVGGALAEGIRTAEAISRAMDRVGELVSDLLDYSRLEAGQLMVHRAQVALRPLLRELFDEMRPLLGDRPLELEIAEDLPPLWADRRRLAQVLMNLLSNAAKYTPRDARMGLRARLCDPIEAAFLRPLDEEHGQAGDAQGGTGTGTSTGAPRTWVLISVWDLGPGIPQEARVRLFDPFYRLTRDVERREGTGLGLYIARGLVETHGGQIWIDDTEGACFSMLWPAAEQEALRA